MCKWLVFLLAGGALQAAIIKGSVVENQTGKALARTLISIQPLPGSAGPSGTVRTNSYGMFEFIDLPGGAYLITASRRGFMTAQYGQKNWRAAGLPIVLDKDQSTFLSIRLPRFSSISGVIVDENDVGLPEHEVVAMSNARPPRMMAKAQADDRGIYRISGLDPGTYLVRTLGRAYEEGGYLPTFYRETPRVDEAGMVDTMLDQETTNIKVRPFPGKLFNISGNVMTNPQGSIATVTLVSDVGRETITTGAAFQFSSKAPGPYEILVEQQPGPRGAMGAYVALALERDMTGMRINVLPMAGVSFYFQSTQGGRVMDTSPIKVLYRRVDLAGEGPAETLRLTNGSASLVQGRWQLMLAPSSAYVATEFFGCRGEHPEGSRADGWNETAVTGPCGIHMVLSDKPGGVNGTVTMGANEPAGGVPVFLEAYDEVTHKRVVDLRSTRTDMRGKYNFAGLAPGTYRLVATFEYQSPQTGDIDAMRPRVFRVEEGRDQQQDLDVWVIR
jgi:Carboxypeptidase regulatory-like domain